MSNNNNSFKTAIKSYLDSRAASDELFAVSYAKENKNLDECCNYILGEAKKRGNAVAMTDEEVYNLAVHYYDEDDIKVKKVHNARVAVSSSTSAPVELTEEEKSSAKERALKAYQESEQKKIEEAHKRRLEKKREKAAQQQEVQPSLFNF